MNSKNFQTFFDCGFSKVRAGTFNTNNNREAFYADSEFFTDKTNLDLKIQKIITSLEKESNEFIDNISLMIDSPKMLSIGISISKKLDGFKLKQANVQFLIQEAKQQILKYYQEYNITHIIINNYRIDNIDYYYLPDEIKCHFISLDILFICLPSDLVSYFKNIFSNSHISIDQVICSSYAKSINYKDNFKLKGYTSFVDVGFKKTSIISYFNDKILSLEVLPLGGSHITKDISKILEIDLENSEQIKRNFDKTNKILVEKNISIDTLQKIIFARNEEILELCTRSSISNWLNLGQPKIFLMGEGSKIMDNQRRDNVLFSNDVDFLDDTLEGICQSGFKFVSGLNKQEVVVVAKKQIKQGFFEKLFHFFS